MPTPKDAERKAAFRAFVNAAGDLTDAAAITGIAHRSLQRMYSGKTPAPPRLLEQCARWADDRGKDRLAARLFDAAAPAEETTHA